MANVLWKLKQLKYLSLNYKVDQKLRFKGLDELEAIYGYDSEFCDTYELMRLHCQRSIVDPMLLLEKLPNLSNLCSDENAYLGTEMVCTAKGFPKLEILSPCSLEGLKEWRVEEGAMPSLSSLRIHDCGELEMLPEGLRYIAVLKSLNIRNMSGAFRDRIYGIDQAEGVDMYNISNLSYLQVL
ncbi:hypothetical protein AgCh_028242 [Apium graveolens]